MHRPSAKRIGILAGGGRLPIEIAEGLKTRGVDVQITAIEGEADPALESYQPDWFNWGQIGGIVSSFKKAGCQQVAIAGSAQRPDLAAIKPDLGFFRALPTVLKLIRAGGDDAILRGVIGFFEKHGIQIVGVEKVAPQLLVSEGNFAGPGLAQSDLADVRLGLKLVHALAPFDVGQAVVVVDGRIEAIEGAEGTDRMLDRLTAVRHAQMRARSKVERGILVKAPKPGQELRVDMPTIGPETVRKAAGADLKGIAVEAGGVLAVERSVLQELASIHRVFVAGVQSEKAPVGASGTPGALGVEEAAGEFSVRRLGRRWLRAGDVADARKGAALIYALDGLGTGRAVVVARRHVLAVEAGESAGETIARGGLLKQWGRSKMFVSRSGVGVVAAGRDVDADLLAKAAEAGLAGVAFVLQKFSAGVGPEVVAEADRRKLFIATVAG